VKGIDEWRETESGVWGPRPEVRGAKAQGGGRKGGQACTFTINPAAHTSPLRLSAAPGEKMNQFADYENRKSKEQWQVISDEQDCGFRIVPIENPKSKIQTGPMARSTDYSFSRFLHHSGWLRKGGFGHVFRTPAVYTEWTQGWARGSGVSKVS